ncbi:MAG: peptide ABC transporter substrate-binding protein [Planctomycetota bacterium]
MRLHRFVFAVALIAFLFGHLPAHAGDEAEPAGSKGGGNNEWKKEFEPEDDSWKSVKQELVFNNGGDPETLDPAKMTGVPEHTLALALYEGLVSHDPETLEPRPGVATHWTMSADGKTYTFHFRADAKWSNGERITAEDFRWSYFRVLHPATISQYAYMLDPIDGALAFRTAGKTDYEAFKKEVGVEVVDDRTLKIRLHAPCAYFLDLCAFETYMPVHRATVEKFGDKWTREENFVGNGPFVLAENKPRLRLVMTPNKHYWDAGFVKLTKISALPLEDLDQVYNKFVKKEVDWIKSVPSAKIDEIEKLDEYYVSPYLGTYFYRFNVDRPHLKDKRVRKALSLAVNRETITKDVMRGGQIPANWFCPAVAGYNPAQGLDYNPDEARRLFAEAGYPKGEGYPDLMLLYNTQEDHKKVAEAIAQMWRENLGIRVKLRNSEWKVYLVDVRAQNYDVGRAGWIGDYGDPMTFMDMWLTGGGNNNTGWGRKRYDELIQKAAIEFDNKKRYAYFREAEAMLIADEFPILPIYIYVNQGMKRDSLRGWYENYRDLHPFQYMYYEPEE